MIRVFDSSGICCGLEPLSGKTKNYKHFVLALFR